MKRVLKTLNLWAFLQIITSKGYMIIPAFQIIASTQMILLLHYSSRFGFKDENNSWFKRKCGFSLFNFPHFDVRL